MWIHYLLCFPLVTRIGFLQRRERHSFLVVVKPFRCLFTGLADKKAFISQPNQKHEFPFLSSISSSLTKTKKTQLSDSEDPSRTFPKHQAFIRRKGIIRWLPKWWFQADLDKRPKNFLQICAYVSILSEDTTFWMKHSFDVDGEIFQSFKKVSLVTWGCRISSTVISLKPSEWWENGQMCLWLVADGHLVLVVLHYLARKMFWGIATLEFRWDLIHWRLEASSVIDSSSSLRGQLAHQRWLWIFVTDSVRTHSMRRCSSTSVWLTSSCSSSSYSLASLLILLGNHSTTQFN